MKILIDGDAFPCIKKIIALAKTYQKEVVVYIDTSHILEDDYAKVITVSKGANAADVKLENSILTQDYGVAIIGLSKGAICINQYGNDYTDYNIDYLMEIKNNNFRLRKRRNIKGPKKRTKSDDERLLSKVEMLIK